MFFYLWSGIFIQYHRTSKTAIEAAHTQSEDRWIPGPKGPGTGLPYKGLYHQVYESKDTFRQSQISLTPAEARIQKTHTWIPASAEPAMAKLQWRLEIGPKNSLR
jgi:hypothetical protein